MSLRIWSTCLLWLACVTIAHAATHQVSVISFRFEPATLTIAPGDTVVWTNTGGIHNVEADNGSFGNELSSSNWTYSHTFPTVGSFRYFCVAHGAAGGNGMAGMVTVAGTAAPFQINPGIGGTWNTPGASAQGYLLEYSPTLNSLVLGWFTWSATTPGQHDWVSAIGPVTGDSATVNLTRSTGGLFLDPTPAPGTSVGTATFRFTDCSNGTVTYNRTDIPRTGTVAIRRLTPVPASCLDFENGANR